MARAITEKLMEYLRINEQLINNGHMMDDALLGAFGARLLKIEEIVFAHFTLIGR